ncbi:right-handed parallel beta-helix repeat-containing protein, partial [Bacillus pseudomycoides]|uniref:right-handed parallel beta-helix repeat-containing protein n=1 Tax=Bacillus pseudomycoides TaxID=64104 RepID=UPI003D65B428
MNLGIITEGNPVLRNCKIYKAEKAGIWVNEKGLGTIENSEIYENLMNLGIITEGNPVLRNCKIYKAEKAGLFIEEKGLGIIENSEIYENNYSNVVIETEGNPILRTCKIYGSQKSGIWVNEKGHGIIEDSEIYENNYSNVVIETEGDPILRTCKIYGGQEGGIWVNEKGRGIIEDSEIYENNYSNVVIETEGNPILRTCKIYGSQESGIWVNEKGRGIIEDSEIHENSSPNIFIETEGNSILRNCKIYKGKSAGVWMRKKGRVTIDNCIIYDNYEDINISDDSEFNIINIKQTKSNKFEEKQLQDSPIQSLSDTTLNLEKIMEELDSLIGMENIKKQIRETIQHIKFNQELISFGIELAGANLTAPHTVLYGNPGTGKTTVAKLIGKLYKAIGLLPSGHIVHVNREKLVGEYIGHTAPKTKSKIDEAIGGVLFIDEAYELTNKESKNDFGPEAIALLLEEMENRKGDFVVIVAGYEKEMMQFLTKNPGLRDRFTKYFKIEDYTPDELIAIAKKMTNDKKFNLSTCSIELLHKEFTRLWRKRDRYFSNARTVRTYIERMLQAHAQRCMKIPRNQWTKDLLLTLTSEDVEAVLHKERDKTYNLSINEELLSEALQQLKRMIGLNQVKTEIEKLVTLTRFYTEEGKDLAELFPHTLLVGNPGTGKTEVARIIAKIYEALGVLERGDLIEINRDKLVSAYSGETEKLISRYIDQSMGGTLFIDEAYQLTQYGPQDPGHKVIDVLLKRMEDDRGKFIVIVAGYKDYMEDFLKSNNGLRSRFIRHIEFEDYTPVELVKISELILQEKGYILENQAQVRLLDYYKSRYENRNQTFGNARLARNLVNESIKNANYRVAKIPKVERTEEIMKTILLEDINIPINKKPVKEVWRKDNS